MNRKEHSISCMLMRWIVTATAMMVTVTGVAQTITNNGGIIYLSPRALLHVNGGYTSHANGQLTADDSSVVGILGVMHIVSGRATFNGRSVAFVDSNLVVGGIPCTVSSGYLVRNGTGTITVRGKMINDGDVTNRASIFIWRDFVNRGTLSNSGLIEVGLP